MTTRARGRAPTDASPLAEMAYVEAIERHLGAHRAREHVLSPRDFALARSWHRSGIPLATVLAGMDCAFASGASVSSLAYCQRRVEELMAAGTVRAATESPAMGTAGAEVGARLDSLVDRIDRLEPPARAPFESLRASIAALRGSGTAVLDTAGTEFRRELGEIDGMVSAAALRALPVEVAAAHAAGAARAVERLRGRVGEEALAQALERFRIQKAREYFGLPLVSALGEALEAGAPSEPEGD